MKKPQNERVNWIRTIPFTAIHLSPLLLFFTGVTWFSVFLCIGLYVLRMFFITAGYHRYFAHRSYQLNRFWQFIMALGGTLAAQKGPLWWAANHRHHHQYSDQPEDIHSPVKGFFWSHVGWMMSDKYYDTKTERIQDFAKYPELRWLDAHPLVPPFALAAGIFLLWGPAALVMGFFVSTILLWHVTFSINSIAHVIGSRRYVTQDTSRNFLPLAILTGGEGWHNNHHYFPSSARQGFFWWEVDFSYYTLKVMSWFRLVKKLRVPPKAILKLNRIKDGIPDIGMFKDHMRRAHRVIEKTKATTGAVYAHQKELVGQAMENAKQQTEDWVRLSKGAAQIKK